MRNPNRLGEYLSARRAQISPETAGLPRSGIRRVPGLRREEVASLAGLSVDYYARLEQGREQHPSASVLNALARTLQLGPDARRYLFAIATPGPAPAAAGRRRVSANLLELVDEWTRHPAILIDQSHDVIAANHLGRMLFAGHRHSDNLARLAFLDADAQTFFRDRDKAAWGCVAAIRAAASHAPDDPDLTALVGELSMRSEDFRRRWARADVRENTSDVLRLRHPLVGDLDLFFETLRPNGNPDLLLKIYRASPGSATADALAILGSLSVPDTEPARTAEPDHDVGARGDARAAGPDGDAAQPERSA